MDNDYINDCKCCSFNFSILFKRQRLNKKFNKLENLDIKTKITNNDPIKNGPNGTSLFFVDIISVNETGKAKNVANIILTNPNLIPKISPITKASFMSPPPNDSLLNNLLPKNPIRYITTNRKIPDKKALEAAIEPKYINLRIIIKIELIIKGESKIIKYLKSDTNIIMASELIINPVKNS